METPLARLLLQQLPSDGHEVSVGARAAHQRELSEGVSKAGTAEQPRTHTWRALAFRGTMSRVLTAIPHLPAQANAGPAPGFPLACRPRAGPGAALAQLLPGMLGLPPAVRPLP